MRILATAAVTVAAATLLAGVSTAMAGVVVEEQETENRSGAPVTHSRTVIIEANRQKIITETDVMVTDLDKGVMLLINPAQKSYAKMPFPPRALGAAMSGIENMNFKKTGGGRTVDGYRCEEYSGTSHIMGTESKIIECFSKDAPGAADFAAFQKEMVKKLKGTEAAATLEETPAGVPLASESTTNMAGLKIPGMPPEQAKKFAQMMANRPPVVTKTEVTKISIKKLPNDTFTIPAGYTEQKIQMPPAAAPKAGQPPPHSLPE